MTKTIIVPLDGSSTAETALGPALWMAQRLDADLVLVMSTFAAETSAEEAALARAVEHVGAPVAGTRLVTGAYPGGAIASVAAGLPDPLVCMVTGARGALGTALLGSVANEVVGHTHVPVVLVGPSYRADLADGDALVACLGHELVEHGPTPAYLALADELGLAVHLVSVTHPPGADPVPGERHHRAGRAERMLAREGRRVTGHDLFGVEVADTVLDLAVGTRARLIAVEAHHGDMAAQHPIGRIARRILQDAPCAVLVHHAADTS
jgi:nucleotide-binding universal stress UspA family protein